jgi:aconitate hydratase 2/2-methylisocitrate dehydratase
MHRQRKDCAYFVNTMKVSGALPIEMDANNLNMDDVYDIYSFDGKVCKNGSDEKEITTFGLKTTVILDEVRAGGRTPLISRREITSKARIALVCNAGATDSLALPKDTKHKPAAFTSAQTMVGQC